MGDDTFPLGEYDLYDEEFIHYLETFNDDGLPPPQEPWEGPDLLPVTDVPVIDAPVTDAPSSRTVTGRTPSSNTLSPGTFESPSQGSLQRQDVESNSYPFPSLVGPHGVSTPVIPPIANPTLFPYSPSVTQQQPGLQSVSSAAVAPTIFPDPSENTGYSNGYCLGSVDHASWNDAFTQPLLPQMVFEAAEGPTGAFPIPEANILPASNRDGTHATRAIAPRPNNLGLESVIGRRPREEANPEVPAKRRARQKLSAPKREKVKRVRKLGACYRCSVLKIACDENAECSSCIGVNSSATKFIRRCYRYEILENTPFRDGNGRVNQKSSELPKLQWAATNTQVCTVLLRYPFLLSSGENERELPILCREFVPRKDVDILEDVWERKDGSKHTIHSLPFACYDTKAAMKKLEEYIDYCGPLFDADLNAEPMDEISALTIAESVRFASLRPDSCVKSALKLRQIAYFCRESMSITGPDTLGIARIDDALSPLHNQIPVPSVLDFQLDTMAIMLMRNLRTGITKALSKKLKAKDSKEEWFEAYLTLFILLSTLESVYGLQWSYTEWNKDMDDYRYSDISSTTRKMNAEWEHSAKMIICHWRNVLLGMIPFSIDWDGPWEGMEPAARANIDEVSLQYLQRLTKLLQDRDQSLRGVRNQLRRPFAWLANLYLNDDD